MSSKTKRGVVQSMRRFFWLPEEAPRRPAPAWPLLQTWLYCMAVGLVPTVLGWDDGEGPALMMTITVLEMLRTVIAGVRHRWPGVVAALAVGWGVNRLAYAVVPAVDSPWDDYAVYAVWTLAALATVAAVSRLPRRQAF